MKVLHVITSLQKAAGTSVFVGELASEMCLQGNNVTIGVVDSNSDDVYPLNKGTSLIGIDQVWDKRFDIVHIHALWSPILHRVSKWARRNSMPVVWSPHGMLQKWALKNKWWKKIAALVVYQWRDLAKADLLHATAESEIEDIRRIGLKNSVVLAPLGVRVANGDSIPTENLTGKKTLLFVSRVQKKKGLPVLIEAWAKLPKSLRDDWVVRIVGPDQDNHTSELKAQCNRLGVLEDFSFVGPKYGNDLDAEYRSADLFVLPTHSENFGSVVIEALARSVPVICSQGAPWKELETYKCGWWSRDSVDALQKVLLTAMSLSDSERAEMGERGKKLVEEKYTWDAVCKAMVDGYKEVLNG